MTKSCDDANQAGRRVRLLALLLASGAGVAAMTPAMAQTTPPPPAADNQLADVVVTASRSGAESLQKVPIAVSVVNIDQITKSGQGNLADLAKFTPSLSITEGAPGYQKFNMRGLSTGGYASSDTSDRTLVAVYLDDTPISVQGQTPDLKVYDLERVEILRGPQGTLYGAGSMAGTVRFVTAKPGMTSTFGTAEAGVATTEHGAASYNLRGMINLPIVSDTLAVRANVYVGHEGGYIDNIGLRNKQNANYNNTAQGRVALRWRPVSELTVDASITYERSIARGLNQGLSGLAPYTVSSNGPEGTDDRFRLYTLGLDYDAGFANVILTGAYTDRAIGFDASPDPQIAFYFEDYGSGLPLSSTTFPLFNRPTSYNQATTNKIPAELYQIDQKLKDYMGEFRLVGKEGGPIKWTVGAYFEQQTRHLRQDIPTPGFDTLSYMNYFYGPFSQTANHLYDSKLVDGAFQSNDIFSGLQDTNEHQFALYGDATWHATEKLDLSAGLRYFNFSEKYYLYEGGDFGVINHTPLTTNARLKSNGINPRGNITYHVSDSFMVFGEVAKGFRYGGANQPVPLVANPLPGDSAPVSDRCTNEIRNFGYSSAPLTFGPDKLWNYTIGEKATLAGGRVTLNASAYYIAWSDVQTRLRLPCSYFFTDNKGKITSKGIELETMVKASPEVTLVGSASYNSSKANGDIPTVGAFDGDRTPYFPAWTASAAFFYDRNVGSGSLHAQLSYQYQSEQYTTFNNYTTTIVGGVLTKAGASTSYAVIPASNNVSASLAYDIGRFEIGVYGNNLFDGVKVTNIGRPATYYKVYQAGDRITLARPRTIGIRAKVKF